MYIKLHVYTLCTCRRVADCSDGEKGPRAACELVKLALPFGKRYIICHVPLSRAAIHIYTYIYIWSATTVRDATAARGTHSIILYIYNMYTSPPRLTLVYGVFLQGDSKKSYIRGVVKKRKTKNGDET